jgi:uncharacterized membrane protein
VPLNDSITYQVQQLLTLNKIAFDKKELAFQIQSHPSYPSLHAITGVLTHFNVDNLAIEVPVTLETLDQLPTVFLARMNSKEDQIFGIVVKEKSTLVTYYTPKNKKKYSKEDFLKDFTGIIVAVEKDETENKHPQGIAMRYLKAGLFASLGFLLIGLFYKAQPSLAIITYSILSLVGVFVSIAIIKQRLGIYTGLGNAFCSDTDTTKNCNTVLSSKGATILGISLSAMSSIYFIGLTLASVAFLMLKQDILYLYLLSFLATPITLYSVYYQYAFAKAWCPLCLVIVALLITQSVIGIPFLEAILEFSLPIESLYTIGTIYIGILLLWMHFEPKLKTLKELTHTEIEYAKFKRNFNLFHTLLTASPKKDTYIDRASEIVFGNKNAPLSIVIMTSPFCGHCKPVHSLIEKILKTYGNLVNITIRISTPPDNKDTDLYKITSRLIEIYHLEGAETCLSAMHDIYGDMNTDTWMTTWGACTQEETYTNTIEYQYRWCIENGINFTPAIIINGHSFPSEYKREDLIHFIEELNEHSLKEIAIPFSSQLQQAI